MARDFVNFHVREKWRVTSLNYTTIKIYNYIKMETIKLQHAILEALYFREIKPSLNTQDELRDHKLIIKKFNHVCLYIE